MWSLSLTLSLVLSCFSFVFNIDSDVTYIFVVVRFMEVASVCLENLANLVISMGLLKLNWCSFVIGVPCSSLRCKGRTKSYHVHV